MSAPWHVNDQLLAAYRAARLGLAQASSVEEHLLACEQCRDAAAALADPVRLERVYAGARALAQAPAPRMLERTLRRLGLSDTTARVLAASQAASRPWMVASLAVLGFGCAAGTLTEPAATAALLSAPLIPLAAVAAAYGSAVDPMAETEAATPYVRLRLVLLRSLALLLPAIAGMLLAAAVRPGAPPPTWLLPSLGLVCLTLVLARDRDPWPYAAGVAAGWLLAVILARLWLNAPIDVYAAVPQVAYAALTLVCCAVLAHRLAAPVLGRTP